MVVRERPGDRTNEIGGRIGGKVETMIRGTKSRCSDNIQSHKGNEAPVLKRTADTYVHIQEKALFSVEPGWSCARAVVTRTMAEPKESGE